MSGPHRRLAGFGLPHLLILLAVAELSINRLVVEALRPDEGAVPTWHVALDHLGLFFLYFTTTLGLACLTQKLIEMWRQRGPYFAAARLLLLAVGLAFVVLAAMSVVHPGAERASFLFQSVFVLFLITLIIAQASARGDLAAKIGVVFLAIPLIVHYYGPFALHFLEGEEARYGDLPEQVTSFGQWSLMIAGLATPYCFAPRPFARSAMLLVPAALAMFVGLLGAIVLRQHLDVALLVARNGFGFELRLGAPEWLLALYLLALATVTWTIVSCALARAPARREIGLGIGLVVAAG